MRILEPEVMMSEEEVTAYDLLARKYLRILHAGFVETIINLSPPKGLFLDVGTGTGWIAIGVTNNNPAAEVWGVDLSDTMLKVAHRNAENGGLGERTRFMKGDAKRLPFDDETFDSVFCHNMLHHLSEPTQMVTEMTRVAKKDGTIIIRDLRRPSGWCIEFHVNILGLPYNDLMKKEYRDSIRAALSESEWNDLVQFTNIPNARLTKQFVTHMSIERPSTKRRQDYIEVPTPFYLRPFKGLYVSRH